MQQFKITILYALILCIACPALYIIEHLYWPQEALQQVGPITLTAIVFFAITALDIYITAWMHRKNSRSIASYYLLMKAVRMCILIVLFVIYALISGKSILLFSANLVTLFFITLVFSTIHYIKVEEHRKKEEAK